MAYAPSCSVLDPRPESALAAVIGQAKVSVSCNLGERIIRKLLLAVLKLGEASVDTKTVLKRRPKLWWSVRDPGWRADFNLRIGLPILGAALAGAFALLISKF
jgi:hypothetical protein